MTAISVQSVDRARRELERMKRSLRSWLSYRQKNDLVLAGGAPQGRTLKPNAQQIVASSRDLALEQRLATQLHAILSEAAPDAKLPDPSLNNNPHAAVELAQIALGDRAQGLGSISAGAITQWLPIAIVGGVLLAITTAIKSQADLAAEKERLACIQAGACTDYGFWLKAAAIIGIGWFAWEKLGIKEKVARMKK